MLSAHGHDAVFIDRDEEKREIIAHTYPLVSYCIRAMQVVAMGSTPSAATSTNTQSHTRTDTHLYVRIHVWLYIDPFSVSGGDQGWTAVTDNYVTFHMIRSDEPTRPPQAIVASRTDNFEGFEFEITKTTRARRTKPMFIQWHKKGSKHNYGLQLVTEEQAIAVRCSTMR